MLIDDEWNGLADLLANLIAKYASELGIDDMPDIKQTSKNGNDLNTPKNRTFVVSENC